MWRSTVGTKTNEPQGGLSREAVIAAALTVLDTDGVDGLSMRAVADRLGVKAASLYWHIRDKGQLLEQITEAVLDPIQLPASPPGWRERISVAIDALGEALRTRPAVASVLLGSLAAVQRSRLVRDVAWTLASAGLENAEPVALSLVLQVASASAVPRAVAPRIMSGEPMTLEIDSGSYRVAVRAAMPAAPDIATSVGGGGAAWVDVRPEDRRVVVRSRRGGYRGAVELNRDIPWHIKVHGGTWNNALDLSGLRITGLELDSGAGNVTCVLPAPLGIVPLRVNSGVLGVTLSRPPDAAVHATVSAGSVKVKLDGNNLRTTTSDVHWDTPGALQRSDRYDLLIFSGCVRVSLDASAPASPPPPPPTPPAGDGEPAADPLASVQLLLDGIDQRLRATMRA